MKVSLIILLHFSFILNAIESKGQYGDWRDSFNLHENQDYINCESLVYLQWLKSHQLHEVLTCNNWVVEKVDTSENRTIYKGYKSGNNLLDILVSIVPGGRVSSILLESRSNAAAGLWLSYLNNNEKISFINETQYKDISIYNYETNMLNYSIGVKENESTLIIRNDKMDSLEYEFNNKLIKLTFLKNKKNNTIPLIKSRGVYMVKATVCNSLDLNFVYDSGASKVTIPIDVFLALRRSGIITDKHLIGKRKYELANGEIIEEMDFILPQIKLGNVVVKDVISSTTSLKATPLLGQSFQKKFKKIDIDNVKHIMTICR